MFLSLLLANVVSTAAVALSSSASLLLFGGAVALLRHFTQPWDARLAMAREALVVYVEEQRLGRVVSLEHDFLGAQHWRLAEVVVLGSLYFDWREHIFLLAVIEQTDEEKVYSCKVTRILRRVKRVETKLIPIGGRVK